MVTVSVRYTDCPCIKVDFNFKCLKHNFTVLEPMRTNYMSPITQDVNSYVSRWDALEEGIKTEQKQLDTQSLQWNSYQDILSQTVAWLDNVEKSVTLESATSLSPQEIRSKLLKLKVSHTLLLFFCFSNPR